MSKEEIKLSPFPSDFSDGTKLWDLENAEIFQDTFLRPKVTNEDVIVHIRDSLSHPTIISRDAQYISTDYTTIKTHPRIITNFLFISPPDVRNDHPKDFNTEEKAQLQLNQRGSPKGTLLSIR